MASQEPAVWLLWAVLGRVAPLVLAGAQLLGRERYSWCTNGKLRHGREVTCPVISALGNLQHS